MPDITYEKLEAIPEGLREHATQKDGKYVVNVVPNAKLVEFRDNNIRLSQERDEYKAKAGTYAAIVGEDIEKFKGDLTTLRSLEQQVKDGKLAKNEDIAQRIQREREEAAKAERTKVEEAERAVQHERNLRLSLEAKVRRDTVRAAITAAATAADSPVNPVALQDVLSRGENVFTVNDDGKVVAMNGDKVIYSARDGATPLSPAEWLASLVKEAPYFGKTSSGGGANGGNGAAKIAGVDASAFKDLSPEQRLNAYRRAQAGK